MKKNRSLNFDLKQLRSYLEVINENSFTSASRKLKIGQATISHHINQLENMLGIRLINRNSKKFSVTEEGKIFISFCDKLFSDIEELKINLKKGTFGGITTITASTIPATYILPGVVSKIRAKHPDLFYKVEIRDSREAVEMIKDGKADIGITGNMYKHPSLQYTPVYKDEIVLIGPLDYKNSIDLNEITELLLITRESGSGTRISYEKVLNENNIIPSDLNVVFESSTSEGVKESVLSGIGAAFISKMAIKKELKLKLLKIIKVNRLKITRDFYEVHLKKRHFPEPAKIFINALKNIK